MPQARVMNRKYHEEMYQAKCENPCTKLKIHSTSQIQDEDNLTNRDGYLSPLFTSLFWKILRGMAPASLIQDSSRASCPKTCLGGLHKIDKKQMFLMNYSK